MSRSELMTNVDVYQPAAPAQYGAAIVMTPDDARALDEQVRRCTEAVLREGTDYGIIPGTSGEKTLWRPGAQKLLQWFRLECTCERIEVERDDDGRKHGITYRAEVGRGLKTATPVILATCEGTADYDETKFYQSAEQVQRKAEDRERAWAAKDGRPARPTKWQGLPEYRADWNALMKRAQKRAIVGAVVDATAAGGIFADREEDDTPAPQDDGPTWYQQALAWAATLLDEEEGRKLYVEAAQAARDSLCTPGQANHIQNRITQRVKLLKTATPVDAEDLARQAAAQAPAEAADDGRRHVPVPESEKTNVEDEPGTVSDAQLTKLHTVLTGLGFGDGDREQKLTIAEVITGHDPLTGPEEGRTSKNLSYAEARKLIDKLGEFTDENGERDRDALIAYMAQREQAGDGDA
jgi:hypothetical protein